MGRPCSTNGEEERVWINGGKSIVKETTNKNKT
jgi:hypothetical protein